MGLARTIGRRAFLRLLLAAGAVGLTANGVWARLISVFPSATALSPDALPDPGRGGFLTDAEKRTVGAVFDRLIPADDLSPSATDCGCVEFLDRQLAGAYGSSALLYLAGPVENGRRMAWQKNDTPPAARYRAGLAAMDALARERGGQDFAALAPDAQDALLTQMENGTVSLGDGVDPREFFALLLQNAREGFLSDPLYGGNRDMAGWRMIGFPGARYDYRDAIDRRGETLGYEPVSLLDPERKA